MFVALQKHRTIDGRDTGGESMVNHVYLNGVRIAAVAPSGSASYYLSDQVDSVTVVLDDGGKIVTQHEYLPFGETWITEGDKKNAPKYNSQEMDRETGYYFYNARHYDPEIGRFVTADTVVPDQYSTQSWNRFSYCRNNPIIYKDPTGHYEKDVHYNLTEYLAKKAGFSKKHAKEIAYWNQNVDEDKKTEPFAGKEVRKEWHFPIEKMGDEVERNSPVARQKVDDAIKNKKNTSFKDFGRGLHVLQDSYSHEGYGARLGHASVGHDPDRTYLDRKKSLEMAHETYQTMQSYLKERGYKVKDEWNKIEKDVAGKIDEFSRKYNPNDDRVEKKK
jgi:RHS repeat-associated protein